MDATAPTQARDRSLDEFAVNGSDRYLSATKNGVDVGKRKFWTMVVHESTCRWATNKSTYFGQGGLQRLATDGFGVPGVHVSEVWLGCKVCGTAALTKAEQRALGARAIAAEEARKRAVTEVRDQKYAIDVATRARNAAVNDARKAWLAQHAAEIADVEAEADRQWKADNPEQAALL